MYQTLYSHLSTKDICAGDQKGVN